MHIQWAPWAHCPLGSNLAWQVGAWDAHAAVVHITTQ